MLNINFYQLIDKELAAILEKFKDDRFLKSIKGERSDDMRKSYALLIWFLEFYARKGNYHDYITDSNSLPKQNNAADNNLEFSDSDASCDIVFDNKDSLGNTIFYVVQSKWNNSNKSNAEIPAGEIKKALNDFETIMRGDIQKVNPKLKKKLEQLNEHIKQNGEVKFIFLSLCRFNPKTNENIASFEAEHERTKIVVIDLNRLKNDYIEKKIKKIDPENPLEKYHNPEEVKIDLQVERLNAKHGNYIKIEKPYDSYVFLIRPGILHDLFAKYGFYLFHRNVRNPLLKSDFNQEIEQTAIDNPAHFWYYNNGITAITYAPFPTIAKEAEKFILNGLQIINGAQTVYALYNAYQNASAANRAKMDSEILVTLRLLKSGGKDFDLNVTRFTNSQNPIQDRDFYANDPIQEELQQQSYTTKYWYEKRRGEFRINDMKDVLDANGIKIIPNTLFAAIYLAFALQEPTTLIAAFEFTQLNKKDLLFISHKDHKDGLYERIFNRQTNFYDMLSGYYAMDVLLTVYKKSFADAPNSNSFHLLALCKVVYTKYISLKISPDASVTTQLIKQYATGDVTAIKKIYFFIIKFLKDKLPNFENEQQAANRDDQHTKFLKNKTIFDRIKDEIENSIIQVSDIDNLSLPDDWTT